MRYALNATDAVSRSWRTNWSIPYAADGNALPNKYARCSCTAALRLHASHGRKTPTNYSVCVSVCIQMVIRKMRENSFMPSYIRTHNATSVRAHIAIHTTESSQDFYIFSKSNADTHTESTTHTFECRKRSSGHRLCGWRLIDEQTLIRSTCVCFDCEPFFSRIPKNWNYKIIVECVRVTDDLWPTMRSPVNGFR